MAHRGQSCSGPAAGGRDTAPFDACPQGPGAAPVTIEVLKIVRVTNALGHSLEIAGLPPDSLVPVTAPQIRSR